MVACHDSGFLCGGSSYCAINPSLWCGDSGFGEKTMDCFVLSPLRPTTVYLLIALKKVVAAKG